MDRLRQFFSQYKEELTHKAEILYPPKRWGHRILTQTRKLRLSEAHERTREISKQLDNLSREEVEQLFNEIIEALAIAMANHDVMSGQLYTVLWMGHDYGCSTDF